MKSGRSFSVSSCLPWPRRRLAVIGKNRRQQRGIALLALLSLCMLVVLSVFVQQLNARQYLLRHEQDGLAALQDARQALIGDASSTPVLADAGYLRLPDLGFTVGGTPTEGVAAPNFSGNGKDRSVAGKFPWKTLNSGVLRDADGECLWYVVSGRFQVAQKTDFFNWDTQGQINVVSDDGTVLANKLAALVVAPGPALDSQSRQLSNTVYRECNGNYDARNYLDAFSSANALGGYVNYFVGSTNNRSAADSADKTFVFAANAYYNDKFAFVTADDVFSPLIKRRDFATAVAALLDYFKAQHDAITGNPSSQVAVAGSKGTDNLSCSGTPNPDFCNNWREMLFLTALPSPAPITIDGLASVDCHRVLIFGGRRTAAQTRLTSADKVNKHNYLESPNNVSFAVPVAAAATFAGQANFDAAHPEADLMRCLL